jgi:hypothetical protein
VFPSISFLEKRGGILRLLKDLQRTLHLLIIGTRSLPFLRSMCKNPPLPKPGEPGEYSQTLKTTLLTPSTNGNIPLPQAKQLKLWESVP